MSAQNADFRANSCQENSFEIAGIRCQVTKRVRKIAVYRAHPCQEAIMNILTDLVTTWEQNALAALWKP